MRFPNFTPPTADAAAFHLPQVHPRPHRRAWPRALRRASAIALALVIAGLLASRAMAFIEGVWAGNDSAAAATDLPLPVTPPGMPPFDYQHWR